MMGNAKCMKWSERSYSYPRSSLVNEEGEKKDKRCVGNKKDGKDEGSCMIPRRLGKRELIERAE